jgi:hypothetical protein
MNNNLLMMARQIQNNPDQLKQMLYQNGKISQEQFEAIKPMNSFSEIGQYLVDNNVIPSNLQNQVKSMFR